MPPDQNLANHVRKLPLYYQAAGLILLVNVLWSLYRLWGGITGDSVIQLLVAMALVVFAFTPRVQTLTVQDRVIRLEMRLRLARVLPPAAQQSIGMLSEKQLAALRFAGDAELPDLVQKVLSGQLTTQKEIKAQIRDWQPDFLRA